MHEADRQVLKYVRGGGEIKVEDDGSINGGGTGHVLSRWWLLPSEHACWARLPGAGPESKWRRNHCKTLTQSIFPEYKTFCFPYSLRCF